ncbi:hypothetical protein LOZ80_25960 [Paenibacillus sp. HWE-109]|uniref:phage adaptor protein n=1 Tax=Paenibacillus sp. HWE-109 TaxID=1306526 RepID=UPI001EDD1107|nr:hypothetical protein [Paenibacillus sp. HWE-109]UKS25026.1 hypothetical protein LOZ80_25960 [Paenibacillus sp. HWE-109]
MTLQEILNEILEKYPHPLSQDNIIGKINTLLKEFFRTIYKPIVTTSYDLLADNPYYPITYSPSKVIDIVVNGIEYDSLNIKGKASTNWYWFTDDNCIAVYPTPTEDVAGGLVVFRYKEPMVLSSSNLGAIPDFDHDFHMLIVYRICKQLAENYNEYDIANGFVTQIDSLMDDFNKGKQEPDYRQVQDVYGGCMLL